MKQMDQQSRLTGVVIDHDDVTVEDISKQNVNSKFDDHLFEEDVQLNSKLSLVTDAESNSI